MESALLFAYGSIKRGHKHHKLLVNAKATYLHKVKTQPNYLLYDTGPFACLKETSEGEGRCIEGELFQVPITLIDELDDADSRFERTHIKLRNVDKLVYGYIYKWSVSHYLDCGVSWPRE